MWGGVTDTTGRRGGDVMMGRCDDGIKRSKDENQHSEER